MTATRARRQSFILLVPTGNDLAAVANESTFVNGTPIAVARSGSGDGARSYGSARYGTSLYDTILGRSGTRVVSATVDLIVVGADANAAVEIRAHDVDNSGQFANLAAIDAAFAVATSEAALKTIPSAATYTIDVTDVVNEVIQRSGFAGGNGITLLFDAPVAVAAYSNLFAASSLKLTIEYDLPAFDIAPYDVPSDIARLLTHAEAPATLIPIGDSTWYWAAGSTGNKPIHAGIMHQWSDVVYDGAFVESGVGSHYHHQTFTNGLYADENSPQATYIRSLLQVPPVGATPLGLLLRGVTRHLGSTLTDSNRRFEAMWSPDVAGSDIAACYPSKSLLEGFGAGLQVRALLWTNDAATIPTALRFVCTKRASVGGAQTQVASISVPDTEWIDPGGSGPRWLEVVLDLDANPSVRTDVSNPVLQVQVRVDDATADDSDLHIFGLWLERIKPQGFRIFPISDGGWNAEDHRRVVAGNLGGSPSDAVNRGYTDEGLRAILRTCVRGRVAIPLIACGINIGAGESSGGLSTTVFRENIIAIKDRYVRECLAAGAVAVKPIFCNPYTFGNGSGAFELSRGEQILKAQQETPGSGRIDLCRMSGVSVPAQGGAFNPGMFHNPSTGDWHLQGENNTAYTKGTIAGADFMALEIIRALNDPTPAGGLRQRPSRARMRR